MKINVKVEDLFKKFKEWAEHQSQIKGVAIVGSFARGDFHCNSDVDFVIISTNKEAMIKLILSDFHYDAVHHFQLEEWGILTSLRIFYENGLEVEYGIVTNEWVAEPLDEGTISVVDNGFLILLDKEPIFSSIRLFLNKG
ncbi:MAG TPA: nucleotidyltransferase domain-containing protein [Pseudoneobacillus sp.]|nr:nucleotidyltransferase domain-containing protein [Pseudoneobacillus sp.]